MPPLNRALAFDEGHDGPEVIAEQLDLDVPWPHQPALEVDARVAEGSASFGTRGANRRQQIRRALDDSHALATTSGNGLDDERVADALCSLGYFLVGRCRVEWLLRTRDHWNTGPDCHRPGSGLAAHEGNRLGRRTDEGQTGIAAGLRERRVLGKEAVSGMDGLGPGTTRDVDDGRDVEIAARRLVAAEVKRLVRLAHVPGDTIAVRVDRDCGQPHLAAGAYDANGDLAAIGDEDFH